MRPREASDHQHKDKSADRQARDASDTIDLIDYLNERHPFVQNYSLFNIDNGVTTQQNLLEYMVRKSPEELTFPKADQASRWGRSQLWRTGDQR